MKTHLVRPGSEAAEKAEKGVGASIFRVIRETLDVIVMITDPDRVRETLRMWEGVESRSR